MLQLSHNRDLSKQNDKHFNSFPSVWYKWVFLFAKEIICLQLLWGTLDANVFKQSFNSIFESAVMDGLLKVVTWLR